jgi:TPP-dependent pyruvate/acetoin dehydrogenase alpha subunit
MRWKPTTGPFALEGLDLQGQMPPEEAYALYRGMLRIRRVEESVARIYSTDKIQSPVHLSIGQEAVSVGVCRALAASDRVYGTYRGHGLYLAKGGDLKKFFAELYGRATGCAKGRGGSMHLAAPEAGLMGCSAIVSSVIPVAVGDALAAKVQGSQRVVAVVFGDGAVDEGVFFESVNFAALKQLPVVFVCENNGYAIHSRVADRHRQTELFRYGESLGVPGERCNGNDVFGVLGTMERAVNDVRRGCGPQLVEFMTYRWQEHVGPNTDHAEAYRDPRDIERARRFDPLNCAEGRLRERLDLTDERIAEWEASVQQEIDEAVTFAEASPFPDPTSLFDDLYEEAA